MSRSSKAQTLLPGLFSVASLVGICLEACVSWALEAGCHKPRLQLVYLLVLVWELLKLGFVYLSFRHDACHMLKLTLNFRRCGGLSSSKPPPPATCEVASSGSTRRTILASTPCRPEAAKRPCAGTCNNKVVGVQRQKCQRLSNHQRLLMLGEGRCVTD